MKLSMRYLIGLPVFTFVLVLVLSWTPEVANSQQTAPKKSVGTKSTKKQVIELGPEIAGMEGRQLRMRVNTIEPGGHSRIHSHKNRPAVAYILQGANTVTYKDGTVKVLRAGDTAFANRDTVHWSRNDGKEPLIFIVVDIYQEKK